MSRGVDRFIASVEVKNLIVDGPPDVTNSPSSKRAPQQKAAARSVEGISFMEVAEKPLGLCAACAVLHCHMHYYM